MCTKEDNVADLLDPGQSIGSPTPQGQRSRVFLSVYRPRVWRLSVHQSIVHSIPCPSQIFRVVDEALLST